MFDISQDVRVSMFGINDDDAKIKLLNRMNKLNVLAFKYSLKYSLDFSFKSNGTWFGNDIHSIFDFKVGAYCKRYPILEGWYLPLLISDTPIDGFSFDAEAIKTFSFKQLAIALKAYVEDNTSDDFGHYVALYAPDGKCIFEKHQRYDDPNYNPNEDMHYNYDSLIVSDYQRAMIELDLKS